MTADGVAGFGNGAQNFRISGGQLADGEEEGFGAMRFECLQDLTGGAGQGAIVKGQDDFSFLEKIIGPVLLHAKTGAACGIDLDCARYAQSL